MRPTRLAIFCETSASSIETLLIQSPAQCHNLTKVTQPLCGLAGVFDSKGRDPVDRELIARMADRLRHRGPDGEGYLLAPGIALGHRRLAIIDPERGKSADLQ